MVPCQACCETMANLKTAAARLMYVSRERAAFRRPRNSWSAHMTDSSDYVPPKVWTWTKPSGGQFASINRPIAGPTHDTELPVGRHPLQLYSLATPNGQKATIMLEELLAAGHRGAEYDAWLIK